MADQAPFPQIPRPVWYGVRSLFSRSLSRKLDENALGATLNVQPAAAKQYLLELRRVGLISEDGTPTDLARRWRSDDSFQDEVEEILRTAYPDSLVDLAHAGSADRAVVERWFRNHGLGEGTARNKAATYLMIANGGPSPDVSTSSVSAKPRAARVRRTVRDTPSRAGTAQQSEGGREKRADQGRLDVGPLNVNLQIHISADASVDQINAIFSAMRSYLHGDQPDNTL